MSLDFNPKYPYMIVAGLVCGNVAVYNMQLKSNKPTYLSSMRTGKHSDIVWKVRFVGTKKERESFFENFGNNGNLGKNGV